jgi:hypothetical protein
VTVVVVVAAAVVVFQVIDNNILVAYLEISVVVFISDNKILGFCFPLLQAFLSHNI